MNPEDPAEDLDHLLMELVDSGLTPAQQLHLMAMLRDDPAAREQYVKYLFLNSLLTWELSLDGKDPRGKAEVPGQPVERLEAPAASPPTLQPDSPGPGPRAWRVPTRRAAAGAAVILLLLGLYRWRSPDPRPIAIAPARAAPATDPRREPRTGGLAILTRAVDVIWEKGGSSPAVGSIVSAGVLRFGSGVLQLEFYSGATIVLEGPAEIELKAIDRIACRYGKLRALVPPRAHGFRVDSSSVNLIDLGTEFGMQVVLDREADVHVFDGKVQLCMANPRPGQEAEWELVQGNGLRIGTGGDITPLAVDSPAFLTTPDLDGLYRRESGRRYNEWLASSLRLAGDARLVAYFAFESDRNPGSRVLVNQHGDRASDGAIVGCEWVDGRWPGKGALEFKRPSDRVRIDVPGTFPSLTLAAWVRIDAIENRFNGLMLTDGFDPGEIHWQIDNLGQLVLGVRSGLPPGHKDLWALGHKNYTSPPVITPEKFGRWLHVATVYDHRARAVTHYLDGVAVGREPLAWNITLRVGEAELGNWREVPYENNPTPIRNLCGRMDEFALFRVALNPEEVRQLYERGADPSPRVTRRPGPT